MKTTSLRSQRLFLTSSGLNQLGSAISYLCFITLLVRTDPVFGISLFIATQYFAIAVSGLLIGFLSKVTNSVPLIRLTELLRFIILITLGLMKSPSLYTLIGFSFAISLCEGIYHPSRYNVINHSFEDNDHKSRFIVRLQSTDNIMMVLGPAISGILLSIFSPRFCFILDGLSYGLNFLFWLSIRSMATDSRATDFLIGYKLFFTNKKILNMNMGRLLGNVIFILWSILLPVLIGKTFPQLEFAKIQGICLSVMAIGLVITNVVVPRLVFNNKTHSLSNLFLVTALVSVCLGIPILCYLNAIQVNLILLISAALVFGIANASFRTAGILIGQKITPRNSLHLVIAASDSIVRITTALFALSVGILFNKYNSISFYNMGAIVALIASMSAIILYARASKGAEVS